MLEHNYRWLTYSQAGTKIVSDFWDWVCMEKVIADYMESSGLTYESAYLKFWEDVKNYDPEDFSSRLWGESLEKAIGSGRLDELRAEYLLTLDIKCEKILMEETQ